MCIIFAESLHATSFFLLNFAPHFHCYSCLECEWFLYMPFLNAVFLFHDGMTVVYVCIFFKFKNMCLHTQSTNFEYWFVKNVVNTLCAGLEWLVCWLANRSGDCITKVCKLWPTKPFETYKQMQKKTLHHRKCTCEIDDNDYNDLITRSLHQQERNYILNRVQLIVCVGVFCSLFLTFSIEIM